MKKVTEAKRNYEVKITREVMDNPKQVYQFYQSNLVKELVGVIETASGHVTDDDKKNLT